MAEYFEREATIKRIQEVYCVGCNSYNGVRCRACGIGDAIDMIEDAPAADVAPVVHGRWIGSKYDPETGDYMEKCSHCGVFSREYWKPHCSECGAKMDGGADHEAD